MAETSKHQHKHSSTEHLFHRERIAVIVALAFIFFVPELGYYFSDLLLPILLIAVGTMMMLALLERDWTDMFIGGLSFAMFAGAWIFYPEYHSIVLATRAAATISITLLTITFVMGPLSHLTKRIVPIFYERRHMGVSSFLFGLLHFHFVFKYYYDFDFSVLVSFPNYVSSLTAILLMTLLAVTSTEKIHNETSEKTWNWVYTGAILIIAVMIPANIFFGTVSTVPYSVLFLLIAFFFAPYSLPKKILRRVSGWKQLHMLMWVIFPAICFHAFIMHASAGHSMLVTMLPIMAFLFVFGIHATGWVVMLIQRIRRGRYSHGTELVLDGVRYHAVSPIGDFKNNKGRKFVVAGNSVAVFKIGDEFRALASVCPHQAGPIEDGEVIGNMVQCPLHNWQFDIDDGAAGPNALECLPWYPTAIQQNFVFVAEKSTEACRFENNKFQFHPAS